MEFKFKHSSIRAKKARLSRILTSKPSLLGMALLFIILFIGGGLLLLDDQRPGALLIALGIPVLMVWVWARWELKPLPALSLSQAGTPIELSKHISAHVLARLPKNPQAIDILHATSGSWQQWFFVSRYGMTIDLLESQLPAVDAQLVWQQAWDLALAQGSEELDTGSIYAACALAVPGAEGWLNQRLLSRQDLIDGLKWQHHLDKTIKSLQQKRNFGGIARDWTSGYTPLLNRYGHNISGEIQSGGFIHRDLESHRQSVDQMQKILADSSRANVVLVGEVGSGKTTTVYALAKRLLTDDSGGKLKYMQVVNLAAPTLLANAGERGQLENLMIKLLNEAIRAKNIVLFLDEAHLFFSNEEGSIDISSTLLQALQGSGVRLVLTMTPKQWQAVSRRNEALAGLLNYVAINPADEHDTMRILEDQVPLLEAQFKVIYTFYSLREAYRLSDRYMHEQAFPGKAISLLELAANHAEGQLVTEHSVQAAIEGTRGVKVVTADVGERDKLLNLEDELHRRLINQEQAVSAVASALRRARSGVGNPERPVGAFLFLGPTGVGKTELSKSLAEVYFGGEDNLVRVDMNEFTRSEDVARFLSPGASGGMSLVERIRKQPYTVVLLDEVEKAHPDVLNVLLQLLDEGVLRDSDDREVSFRDAIIIATSNAGAEEIRQRIAAGQDIRQFSEQLTDQLINSGIFRPEWLNRFDEIVFFRPLTPEELLRVTDLILAEVNRTLSRQKVQVDVTESGKHWLVNKGYDPRLGARPLRRVVQRSVEDIVAKRLLEGSLVAGGKVVLDEADFSALGV